MMKNCKNYRNSKATLCFWQIFGKKSEKHKGDPYVKNFFGGRRVTPKKNLGGGGGNSEKNIFLGGP